jgi:hypothetical protein
MSTSSSEDALPDLPPDASVTIDGSPVKTRFKLDHYHFLYTSIWTNMERENALIDHRLNWALVFTAGFITAQAFVAESILDSSKNTGQYMLLSMACFFMLFMSIAALYMTLRVSVGVDAAVNQLAYLKYFYLHTRIGERNLFEDYLRLPRPFGAHTGQKEGSKAPRAIPLVLQTFWAGAAFVQAVAGVTFFVKHQVETEQRSARPAVTSSQGTPNCGFQKIVGQHAE